MVCLALFAILLCSLEVFAAPKHPFIYRDGDVLVDPLQPRNFWKDPKFKWPRGQMPYVLSTRYSESDKRIIMGAINEWNQKTCVKIIPRTNQADYVEITPNDGTSSYCYSYVGRNGGRQLMKMYGECLRHAAMIHELGHAIGFNHEHQRPDRDDYITVHLQNIEPAFRYAFDKFSYNQVDNVGSSYDYKSVMQYPYHAFVRSTDPKAASMTLKDGSIDAIRSEATQLSAWDIWKANRYFNNCQ